MRAWKLQFMFGKCVLRQQPEIRGGKKKKVKRNETLRTGLMDRLTRWNAGRVDELWTEACKLYPAGERPVKAQSMTSNIRRATECAQDARYGKAVSALLSLGTCPVSEETLKEMRAKHPEADMPGLPSGIVRASVRCGACSQEGRRVPYWICCWCFRYEASVSEGHSCLSKQSCW